MNYPVTFYLSDPLPGYCRKLLADELELRLKARPLKLSENITGYSVVRDDNEVTVSPIYTRRYALYALSCSEHTFALTLSDAATELESMWREWQAANRGQVAT